MVIFNLISRDFAPLEERLRSVISRENEIASVLLAARENLVNPPIEYTQQAIDQLGGAIDFFAKLPIEFSKCTNKELLAQFEVANAGAIKALGSFHRYLQEDLVHRSRGKFAVGEAEIQAIIDVEEMIDIPVSEILAILYHDLTAVEKEIDALAHKINPDASIDNLVREMRSHHASPDKLKEELEVECKRMRSYLTQYDFMTIPPDMPDVIVEPMPEYTSGGGMMLTPGPFETVAKESYLKLQIPKPGWAQERIDGLWSDFNHYALVLLVLHECYPGHHTQFYLEKNVPMLASRDHDLNL